MSLPLDTASSLALAGVFLPPDNLVTSALEDFEQGGVDIQNSSLGLTGYQWRCWVQGTDVFIQRAGAAATLLFSDGNIVEVSFAFDQAMRPHVAYQVLSGDLMLRWYDSYTQSYRTDSFGSGKNPRMSLDDKRTFMIEKSDVVFAYLRNGGLYYRQQRDRFGIEYTLRTGIASNIRLKNIGMSTNLRMQFELV